MLKPLKPTERKGSSCKYTSYCFSTWFQGLYFQLFQKCTTINVRCMRICLRQFISEHATWNVCCKITIFKEFTSLLILTIQRKMVTLKYFNCHLRFLDVFLSFWCQWLISRLSCCSRYVTKESRVETKLPLQLDFLLLLNDLDKNCKRHLYFFGTCQEIFEVWFLLSLSHVCSWLLD